MLAWVEGAMDPAEVPPEDIWHHPERIEEWFEAIKQRRDQGLNPIEEPEDADMTANDDDLIRALREK